MCGIAGILNLDGEPLADASVVAGMRDTLIHRGPDEAGSFEDGPVSFGFRRLRIIDLETGQQPVSNEDGTVWVMLNGEIYNYLELRDALGRNGHAFHTRSDTEVIVHAYESFGLDFLDHLRGMFAIALWDGRRRRLILARDRVGKKPLFYAVRAGQLAFASEVKAFLRWPHFDRRISRDAVDTYLRYLFIPGPSSIFQGVRKLSPASLAVVECGSGTVREQRYWRPAAERADGHPLEFYAEGLREVVDDAVRLRLRSDVPLGSFLSGGLDSTIVSGVAARHTAGLRTFSIGFDDRRFDETSYARAAAAASGTQQYEETVNAGSFHPQDLPRLVWYMDEPFGDSSFLPTYWLCRMARRTVTVALSGDGGDELFGGYTRYRHFQSLRRLAACPAPVRKAGAIAAAALIPPALGFWPSAGERLRRVQRALALSGVPPEQQMDALVSYFDSDSRNRLCATDWWAAQGSGAEPLFTMSGTEPLSAFMSREFETSMVDDSLVKVDRASMACSLEVRCPLLDHRVAEFAMQVPVAFKMRGREQKIVLRHAFRDLVPEPILNRGKQGFEAPLGRWFQSKPWRDLLTDTLNQRRLGCHGIFEPRAAVALRDQLLRDPEASRLPMSAYQLRHRVWALLVFQLWYDQYMH